MKRNGFKTEYGLGKKRCPLLAVAVLLVCCLTFAGCSVLDTVTEYLQNGFSTAVNSSRQNASNGLVINEVVSSNKRSLIDDAYGSPDWVELYNAGDVPIDLAGYGISDNIRNFHKYEFGNIILLPGEYLVLYCADDCGDPENTSLAAGFGLAKSGENLFITDAYYGLVAEMEIPALITDVSYARRPDGTYGYSGAPTPGAENGEIRDSMDGLFDEQNLAQLTITEVLPKARDDGYPWVELRNEGSESVRLENYYLTDNPLSPQRWQLPESSLEPGGYVVIYLSGLNKDGDEIHADFKLGKNDSILQLYDYTGAKRGEFTWDTDILPGYSVVSDVPAYTYVPTPGAVNSPDVFTDVTGGPMESTEPIRISEALRKNKRSTADMDGDRCEWVELHNVTSYGLSLSGYFLSDDPDDLLKWALPDISLGPNGYIVIFLSGKDRTAGELHASFRLGDDEPRIYLTRASGLRTDTMEMPIDAGADVSVGRDAKGNYRYYATPTPGTANGYGFETAEEIGFFNSKDVYISEVSAAHTKGSSEIDWIELYNGGDKTVDLSGWQLTDDPEKTDVLRLDGVQMESGAYYAVGTTANSSKQKEGVGTFGIAREGDTVYLLNASGAVADSFETGLLRAGVSAGRIEGEESVRKVYFTNPTKGSPNDVDSAVTGYSPEPVFAYNGLYCTEPFDAVISCRDPYAEIFYTTDGTKPTTDSHRYEGPIHIEENTVIRAVSLSAGLQVSEIATQTYLFDEPHTIPVVSMIGDRKDIDVIYATKDRENKPERECYIQFYEAEGLLGTEFPAGLKAKGAGTLNYRQKSFTLHLKDSYGQDSVTYPFYSRVDYPVTTFSALALRNSGQDHDFTRIKNSFFSRATYGMHIDSAMTRPVALYINGAYWGLYDLDEDINKDYLAAHYGVDPEKVDIVRRNQTALAGSAKDFLSVRDMGRNGSTNKDSVFAQYAERIDVEYFTDYYIAQTYFHNNDMFNQKYWRSQDGTVKWRPVCFDQDFLLSSYSHNMMGLFFSYDGVASNNGSTSNMDCFIGLKKNDAWCDYCAERYVQLICTQFSAENMTALLDEMTEEMRPEMERHIARWKTPGSMATWEKNIATLRSYLERRPAVALENVRKYFGISKDQMEAWITEYTP